MITKPAIVGIRQIKPDEGRVSVNEAMRRTGRNSGNMMFAEALNAAISGGRAISYQLTAAELSGRDAIVLAAANWLNPHGDFGNMAAKIEATDLPVFAVGIGAQASLKKEIPRVSEGTLRLLKVISERSTSISTRGSFSSEVLEHYGIKNSVPTGCPSLLLTGRKGVQFDKTANLEKTTVHGTRHGFHPADAFHQEFYKAAYQNRADILLQSETADIIAASSDLSDPEELSQARGLLKGFYGAESDTAARAYVEEHAKFFTDYESWIGYMRTRSFCVGTRIHGTIASLIAGTPALLIAHDSRTLELATTMGVPHIAISDQPDHPMHDMQDLVETFKIQAAASKHSSYIAKFDAYFAENGLPIAY